MRPRSCLAWALALAVLLWTSSVAAQTVGPDAQSPAGPADLTWEDFAAGLAERPGELARVDLDPLSADFFGLVERELNLNEKDVEKLRAHGLVLLDPSLDQSFPVAYYNLYTRDLPLLITTDSILHAFHRTYDTLLVELETTLFIPRVERSLSQVHAGVAQAALDRPPPPLLESLRDVDLYLTVARNLLKGSPSGRLPLPSQFGQDDAARAILDEIYDAAGTRMTALYGGERPIDYTQFTARGHYRKTAALERYFRCLMWLGRADCGWNVAARDSTTGVVSKGVREARGAALLALLLESTGSREELESVDRLLGWLVGRQDSLDAARLRSLLEQQGLRSPRDLEDAGRVAALQQLLLETPASQQQIRSQVLLNAAGTTSPLESPRIFQLFGQRFVLDSYLLSQVVHDAILYQGRKVERMMPTGLDVMAGLGNDLAARLLEPELRKWNYAGNLAQLRGAVAAQPADQWNASLYSGWLDALRELDRDLTTTPSLPRVFRTESWRRKQLQTQLASWSELRHDTMLYAKASYSVPECEVPAAYVEPYPRFYGALAGMARRAAQELDAIERKSDFSFYRRWGGWGAAKAEPDPESSYAAFFLRMAGHLETLQQIATKEIAGQPLAAEEVKFLQTTISQQGNVLFGSGAVEVQMYDGWYPQLILGFKEEEQDAWQATIADVHTDASTGQTLEVGVGRVNYCVALIDLPEGTSLYVGPAYSYYEFTQPVADRLTDQVWQARITNDNLPNRPAFIAPLVGGDDARTDPPVRVSREGDTLTITVDHASRRSGVPGIHSVPLSAAGFQKLTQVAPGLRYLDASDTAITDEDLAHLTPLYNLKAIDLSGTPVTEQGLRCLAKSRFLRQAMLRGTKLEASLEVLAQWPYLEKLDLRDTNIGNDVLFHLEKHRHLRELRLEGTRVTAGGVAYLQESLPDCQVSWSSGGGR